MPTFPPKCWSATSRTGSASPAIPPGPEIIITMESDAAMAMERRVDALEEISQLLITAMRGMNESLQRLEALERQREALERQRAETLRELSAAVRRTDAAIQALLAFVPVTQAEIIRLDHRIDQIGGEGE